MRRQTTGLAAAALLAAAVLGQPQLASANAIAGPACDFNGDSRSDLAIGAPGESVGNLDSAGSVNVLYGSAAGVAAAKNVLVNQDNPGIAGVAERGDAFGHASACGDFDNDGFGDLAVGVPHEGVESATGADVYDAGAVNIFYGSAIGLATTGNQVFTQSSPGMPDSAERTDEFGTAVAAGDFDNDGRDDLAIGAPKENVDGFNQAGNVIVLRGGRTGLSTTGSQVWHQGSPGIAGEVEGGDNFGSSLATGDFDGDGRDDLVVGSPGEAIADQAAAGNVNVIYGSTTGLVAAGNQILNQSTAGVPGNWEANDLFGSAVTAGDFNDDGRDDLAVGVPGENDGETRDAGAVNVTYGTADGLQANWSQIFTRAGLLNGGTPSSGDQFGTALAAGNFNGPGGDDLAIGAPGTIVDGNVAAGRLTILYGAPNGLLPTVNQQLSQGVNKMEGATEAGDYLGYALAAGDFDGNGRSDLAAGAPGEAVDTKSSGGAVNVLYGTTGFLSTATDQVWTQDSNGIHGVAQANDRFGGPSMSTGEYRIGYKTGTTVKVTNDLLAHNPLGRIDMSGVQAGPDYELAAARGGVIRYIVDTNAEPTSDNNYVWIEHPDGEWSKYSHVRTGSVTSRGHKVGDTVTAGTVLGLEDEVGQADGNHLHFEVSVPYDAANPITSGGFMSGLNRNPVICGIPGNAFFRGQTYTATNC
ncbi:peptidoglycan DD-metalloendopeptidase family protein [Kribbella sp. CA-293567]|uniref:peptidoglycan DD-metalloendopeptidase family protein n=1 Tax=Kribbella sp. CA-293567 TaxID=3002436 RepID=UPI0022DD6E82|nr:peptidoglycan DD-metalloendopeptidase family protein [Kribbella sp. CA-293567]WBQ03161.1 peptidoglycan DD-metalloendopeptidase family protein [Kribbella sp. CA-293567]